MPYLTLDIETTKAAWNAASETELPAGITDPREQLDFGRRAVAVHVPQHWPHGVFCHNCGHRYPCKPVTWAMRMLHERGWELADVIDHIEAIQAGDRL